MATVSNTPRPGYVWDATDNVWYPIGVGAHQHTNAADTPAVMPYSTYAAAGKNKIINGDFGVWQRGTSISSPAGFAYTADRWKFDDVATTGTISRQSFTPGQTAVSGNPQYFMRIACTTAGGSPYRLLQPIEAPDAFSGQTFTLSFWAKTPDTGNISQIYLSQNNFASGARTDTKIDNGTISLTSSWQKFVFTGTYPSTTGKTLNASTYASVEFYVSNGNSKTVDIAQIQLEAGSTATAFQTATGNPASELAACMRYFQRLIDGSVSTIERLSTGNATSTTAIECTHRLVVPMRTAPTLSVSSASHFWPITSTGGAGGSFTGMSLGISTPQVIRVDGSGSSGLTAGNATSIQANGSSSRLDVSAEL